MKDHAYDECDGAEKCECPYHDDQTRKAPYPSNYAREGHWSAASPVIYGPVFADINIRKGRLEDEGLA
jgi:hypothetical protein